MRAISSTGDAHRDEVAVGTAVAFREREAEQAHRPHLTRDLDRELLALVELLDDGRYHFLRELADGLSEFLMLGFEAKFICTAKGSARLVRQAGIRGCR